MMHSKGRKWQWEMSVCWGDGRQKPGLHTGEGKGTKAVGEQGQ